MGAVYRVAVTVEHGKWVWGILLCCVVVDDVGTVGIVVVVIVDRVVGMVSRSVAVSPTAKSPLRAQACWNDVRSSWLGFRAARFRLMFLAEDG